jgi:hypothetical protein
LDRVGWHEEKDAANIGYEPADAQDTGRTCPGGSDNVVDVTPGVGGRANEDPTEQSLE